MKNLTMHLISESSGQSVRHASNTALAKFSHVNVKKYHWPMTRNIEMLETVLQKIKVKPGVILYTISDAKIRKKLKEFSFKQKLPCISVVSHIVKEIAEYIDQRADAAIEYNRKFDESYFDKVEAIDFSLNHDDGQRLSDLEAADIILIGPSRTSKTPTSVYLSYNGFKTANVPLIDGCSFPDILPNLKKPVIFGLTINPARLAEIRESRMHLLNISETTNYTALETIRQECRQLKKICVENNWQIIDVSMRSIEETAAIIMKAYYEHKKHK